MSEPVGQVLFIYIIFALAILSIFILIRRFVKFNRIVLVILLLSPWLLYVPTELKTLKYGKEFKSIQIETGFNLPIIYYRVFSYSDTSAKLFIVEGEDGKHKVGNFYWFTKENGQWKYNKYETVWSNLGGSASEFTVPPYF